VPLRGGFVRRRPGESAPGPQLCLTPLSASTRSALGRAHRPSESRLEA
jgi:hypothetical protein